MQVKQFCDTAEKLARDYKTKYQLGGWGQQENGYYLLRSDFNAPDDVDGKILFSSQKALKEGDIVKVKILESYVYDLYGEMVD